MKYYRYIRCYCLRTREKRDCNTIEFCYYEVAFFRVSVKDHITKVVDNIATVLS